MKYNNFTVVRTIPQTLQVGKTMKSLLKQRGDLRISEKLTLILLSATSAEKYNRSIFHIKRFNLNLIKLKPNFLRLLLKMDGTEAVLSIWAEIMNYNFQLLGQQDVLTYAIEQENRPKRLRNTAFISTSSKEEDFLCLIEEPSGYRELALRSWDTIPHNTLFACAN